MATKSQHEERRRVLRRMEWFFVYLPPLLAALIAGLGAALVAWLAPIGDTTFWERWAVIVLIVLGVPIAWKVYMWRQGK